MSRIAVIGAGVLGAATGWRLVEAGHDVTLFDPTPGGVASPGSFAWLNASFAEDPVYNRLRRDSLRLWHRLAAETDVPVRFPGAMLFEQPHFDLPMIAAAQAELGLAAEWLDRAGAEAREPDIRGAPDRALFCTEDGHGDPVEITGWFLAQAEAAGASLVPQAVTGITVSGDRATAVETAEGETPVDHVVVAAGIGLGAVLERLGLALAMEIEPGLLARTTPSRAKTEAMLALPGMHAWQRRDGGFLIGADFGGGDPVRPQAEAAAVLAGLKEAIAGTDACEITTVTVRDRPKPADGRPAIGPLGPAGLYVISTHSGMTLAPVIAEMVTAEIAGQPDPRLAPYRPDRTALQPRGSAP